MGERQAAAGDEARADAEISASPTAAIVIDADGVVRAWSDVATELFGHPAAAAIGVPVSELVIPEPLRRSHEASLARVRHTGISNRLGGVYTLPALRADGHTFVVEITLSAIDVAGEEWYLGLVRRPGPGWVPTAAEPTSDLLREIFDRAPEAITILDRQGRQRSVNRAGARLFGYGDEGRYPGDGRSFVHPDDFERVASYVRRWRSPDGPIDEPIRYRVLAGDGTWRWLEMLVADLRDVPAIEGYVAFSREVTGDEERRELLAASEARLAAAIESLPAAAVIEDADRRIAHHNARFAELAGCDPGDDLTGEPTPPHLDRIASRASTSAQVSADFDRAASGFESLTIGPFEIGLRTIEVESVPVGPEGEVVGRLWVLRDVTERVLAEARLREILEHEQAERRLAEERNELLRRLDQARLVLVSSVSHELRTPLASVLGAIDHLMSLDAASPEELETYLGVAQRAGVRLARLIEDLLTFGRIESGLLPLAPVAVDLPALVREVALDASVSARDRDVTITVDAVDGPLVSADDLRIRQAIGNVVSNAVKFGPDGGTVSVVVRPDATGWHVDVHDDGPGIPAPDRERVFEPFVRLQSQEHAAIPGSGLGLAIVRGLLALHGGTAEVLDVPAGTTVRCHVPMSPPP
jgi:PAS domain S-box-containing protein